MSTISSTSSFEQVQASYIDSRSYLEDRDVAKARALITAGGVLLLIMPQASGTRESHTMFPMDLIKKEIDDARTWLLTNDTSTSSANNNPPMVTRASVREFRS